MEENTPKVLTRDCEATQIPSGKAVILLKDTIVTIMQALGGSYTVASGQGLARIADGDADALGLESKVVVVAEAKELKGGKAGQ